MDDLAGGVGPALFRAPLLVGRTLEQFLLREELAAAGHGHGRLVLIGGEAGIGKTTLARDLARTAAERGFRMRTGSCYDLTNTAPYGLWLDLFDDTPLAGDPPLPAAFAGGRLDSVADQAALFADVRAWLAGLSATAPLVLLLEDLHWADPASLDLLRDVVSRLNRRPILIIGTYRDDELTRLHPLVRQIPALLRAADGLRLDLRRLDANALRTLVSTRYDLPNDQAQVLVAYLERRAEGNPFFTIELLRALQEDSRLLRGGTAWALGTLDGVSTPPYVRQVIDNRITRLGETTRELLAVAAIIGQEVSIALWARVAGTDEESLLDLVDRAADAHILEATPRGDRVRFVHALTREALYEGVLPHRRRRWHAKVADALVPDGHADPDIVAYHLQQSGDPRACEWLIRAGDRAQRAYAWLTAADRFQTAFTLLEGVEERATERARLACRIAYLKRFSDPGSGLASVEEAARIAQRVGDASLAAESLWIRGMLLVYLDRFRAGLTDISAAYEKVAAPSSRALAREALQTWIAAALPASGSQLPDETVSGTLDDPVGECVWRGVNLGRYNASAGHAEAVLADCGPFIDAYEQENATPASVGPLLAFTQHALGIAHADRGNPDAARRSFSRATAIFEAFDHHAMVAFTKLNELRDVTLTYDADDPQRRRQLASEAEAALAGAAGALPEGFDPRLARLGCLLLDGEWNVADEILSGLAPLRHAYLRREATAARATLARHRGAPEIAWDEIHALLPAGPATEPGDVIHQEGLFLLRLAADIHLDGGDIEDARSWLTAHDRWRAWSHSVLGQADGRLGWARLHHASRDSAAARTAAMEALALAATPNQPLVALAAHRLLGVIAADAGRHGEAVEHFAASLDLADGCSAPFERALTHLATAESRRSSRYVDEAVADLDEARLIFERLGAGPALARADALPSIRMAERAIESNPVGLTPRELDVLRLLPRGLSNAEIADCLFLSPRTVQTHLTNLYGKLGVGGRPEAVAYAVTRGLV